MLHARLCPDRTGTSHRSGEKLGLGTYCIVIASLVLFLGEVQAQSGAWTRKRDMPRGRAAACAVVVNNRIYVLGGAADISLADYNDNQVYDPSTDTWETKAPLPTARALLSAVAVNDTIYAIGGSYGHTTSVVESYDPVTNAWSRKADMLKPRFAAAAGVVDGIIYNVGGNHTESNCEAYDPTTDMWARKADIPETYGGPIVASSGGLLYAFGGGFVSVFSTTFAYDPQTGQWTKKRDMPTPRAWSHPAPVIDGKIYVIGGHSGLPTSETRGDVLSDVEVYDPVSDTWTKSPDMPVKRTFFAAAAVNGKIYVIGGFADDWSTVKSEVWKYDPSFPGTGVTNSSVPPKEFVLEQNYPNPFNPTTGIRYQVSGTSEVRLVVYDVLGREVETLVDEKRNAGTYQVTFDGTGLSSGIYICRMSAGTYRHALTMVLMK
jgi:N-acetylneuraminic acid mutarotase